MDIDWGFLAVAVAGVFGAIDVFRSGGRSLTSWGVVLLAVDSLFL